MCVDVNLTFISSKLVWHCSVHTNLASFANNAHNGLNIFEKSCMNCL